MNRTDFSSSPRLPRLVLLLMLVAALLLNACNRDDETPAGEVGLSAGGESAIPGTPMPTPTPFVPQGDLTLWHSWGGADADALSLILARVKQQFPAVNVQTLFVGANDLPQAYADAVRAGGGPDLAVTANWWVGDLVDAGVVRPLDDLAQPAQIQQFNSPALRNFTRNGQMYGVPTTFEVVGLFRNNALAATQPAPNTTDVLLAQAAVSPTLGVGIYANLYHVWWGFPAYGAQLFDANNQVALGSSTGASDFLGWLTRVKATPGSWVDADYGMLIDRFKKGEFAYFVDGPWATGELREALGANLVLVPLPAGRVGGAQPWLSSDGLILNPNLSPDRTLLAWFLASALSDPAAGSTFASVAGRLPANSLATLPEDPILRGFVAQAATAAPAPAQPAMDAVWGYGGDMLIKVLSGSMEPSAAVAETVALINEEITP